MIAVRIIKNGGLVTSFTIPDVGMSQWSFDGYILEATPLTYPAAGQYSYVVPTPDATAAAVDRMTSVMTSVLDKVMAETQKDRDFWRSRALALETENSLLRPDG